MPKSDSWLWVLGGLGILAIGGGGVLVGSLSGNLSAAQILQLSLQAGFASDAINATAVALAESSGNPNSLGDIGIGQGSFGLWQISSKYHPEYGPNFQQLYDPQTNANAAYAVYVAAGYSFSPWSTFKNGAYLTYVPTVQAVANG